jgi:hypothetical protein
MIADTQETGTVVVSGRWHPPRSRRLRHAPGHRPSDGVDRLDDVGHVSDKRTNTLPEALTVDEKNQLSALFASGEPGGNRTPNPQTKQREGRITWST